MIEYLGDGVYVDDTFGVELYTSDGISKTNSIYLEPEVLKALINFLDRGGY